MSLDNLNDTVKNNALDLSVLQYAVNSALGDMNSIEEAMSNTFFSIHTREHPHKTSDDFG